MNKEKFLDSLQKNAAKMEKVDNVISNTGKILFLRKDGTYARNYALERDDYTCFCCGYRPKNINRSLRTYGIEKGKKLTVHRIVHENLGGDYVLHNVVILCEKCHSIELSYFKSKYLYRELEGMDWSDRIEKSFEHFKIFIEEFGHKEDIKPENKEDNNKIILKCVRCRWSVEICTTDKMLLNYLYHNDIMEESNCNGKMIV